MNDYVHMGNTVTNARKFVNVKTELVVIMLLVTVLANLVGEEGSAIDLVSEDIGDSNVPRFAVVPTRHLVTISQENVSVRRDIPDLDAQVNFFNAVFLYVKVFRTMSKWILG